MSDRLAARGVPNRHEMQHKSLHRPLTQQRFGIGQRLHFGAWAIDLDGAILGVDHPREFSAVLDRLAHLFAQGPQAVRRANLNHEIRTEMPKSFEHPGVEPTDSRFASPGSVGRPLRSIRKNKAGCRAGDDALSIGLHPIHQLAQNRSVSYSRQAVGRRRYNQCPLGRDFEEQVGMLGTEFGELVIRHRMHREHCRQNDDITVVRVRRMG